MTESLCDHCRSSMDAPVMGVHGYYCSRECVYAEEIDGPEAHGENIDVRECPGCYGDLLTDRIHAVSDADDPSHATAKLADWTPEGMYATLTDAVDRALYNATGVDGPTLEDVARPTGRTVGWAAVDEETGEVVHVELKDSIVEVSDE